MLTAGSPLLIKQSFVGMRSVELFEVLASTTWRTIHRANRNRVSFGEDAITSINLNAIASLNDRSVAIEDARVDEAHKGCDFEMWIGNDSRGWSRYAVQAKKITASSGRYEKLSHAVRGRYQIEILNDYAKRVRAAPIYCFYNFAPYVMNWNCGLTRDETQLGCMVAPAVVVEQALHLRGCRDFGWLHTQPESVPWRCLLRCPRDHHHKYDANARSRWPALETHHHRRLPEVLEVLRSERRGVELLEPESIAREDERLYPRWTVVVESDG
jgi:hypothetical protein